MYECDLCMCDVCTCEHLCMCVRDCGEDIMGLTLSLFTLVPEMGALDEPGATWQPVSSGELPASALTVLGLQL